MLDLISPPNDVFTSFCVCKCCHTADPAVEARQFGGSRVAKPFVYFEHFFAENPVDLVQSKEYLQNATLLTIMARLNDGVERSHDSPMEYAWTDGRGPVDHTSPFVQNGKTAEDQRWAAGQKRRFSALSCIGSLKLMKSMLRTLKSARLTPEGKHPSPSRSG